MGPIRAFSKGHQLSSMSPSFFSEYISSFFITNLNIATPTQIHLSSTLFVLISHNEYMFPCYVHCSLPSIAVSILFHHTTLSFFDASHLHMVFSVSVPSCILLNVTLSQPALYFFGAEDKRRLFFHPSTSCLFNHQKSVFELLYIIIVMVNSRLQVQS